MREEREKRRFRERKSKGVMECDKETRQLTERRRSPIQRHSSADSQLTDLVGHFLQFVLRTTHDDHIQSLPGQLEMKQPSNHVCN